MPIPSDSHVAGDPGHVTDHNNIADELTAVAASSWISVTSYGADAQGNSFSDTAFTNWVNALNSSNQPGYIPPGNYKFTAALNWKVPGLVIKGAGAAVTILKQATPNTPVVIVAGSNQDISGLTLEYSTQPAPGDTSSVALALGDDNVGSCFMSNFHEINIYLPNVGIGTNPNISSKSGVFSCTFSNIQITQYVISAISIIGGNNVVGAANDTGCVFNNIYTHNNPNGINANAPGPVIFLENWDECVWNQLNIEHGNVTGGHLIQLIRVGNAVFNSLHVEAINLSGNGFAAFKASGAGTVIVNGLTMRGNTFSGSASNPVVTFFSSGGSHTYVQIAGFNEHNNTITTPSHPMVDFGSPAATNCTAVVYGLAGNQTTTNSVNAGTGDTATIGP